jgi:phosphoribosylformylglycinamidine synthase subunit PurQ / glutaminase
MTAKIGVVTFPGSLDDHDALRAVRLAGGEAVPLWHGDQTLNGVDAVILPGGFSYGDYLRCGAISRFAPVMTEVVKAAESGMPVLGICNGFQILCEAGLLPGALRPNRQLEFVCRDAVVRVESADTVFTRRCQPGQELVLPVKHGEGAWYADEDELDELAARGQIAFRYAEDVNGSVGNVAGVVNEAGNVLGLMPHPEHAVDPLLGSADGGLLLAAVADAAAEHVLAAA